MIDFQKNRLLVKPGEILLHVAIWSVLSILFTAIILQYSFNYGRLTLPCSYDDVSYFLQGARKLRTFYEEGMIAVLKDYLHHPLHSPFSIWLSACCFAIFGIHDWAPYIGNAVIIFAFLGCVDYLLGNLALRWKILWFIFTLTFPFSAMIVHEFRPDLANGLLVGMGIVLFTTRPFLSSNLTSHFPGLLCFAAALVTKPSVLPFTLLMFTTTLCGVAICERWLLAYPSGLLSIIVHIGKRFAILALCVLPYHGFHLSYHLQYTFRNLVINRDLWAYHGADRWMLYLRGYAGQMMLGRHLYLVGAVIVVGGLLHLLYCKKEDTARTGTLAGMTLLSWIIVTANAQTQFTGAVFYFLLFFEALIILRNLIYNDQKNSRDQSFLFGGMIALTLAGLMSVQFPPKIGARTSPQIKAVNRMVRDVFLTITSRAEEKATVYFTTIGYLTPTLFEYVTLQQWETKKITYLPFDLKASPAIWQSRFDAADIVVAGESGTDTLENEELSSGQIREEALLMLRSRRDYAEIASFPTHTGKRYFVFQKRSGASESY